MEKKLALTFLIIVGFVCYVTTQTFANASHLKNNSNAASYMISLKQAILISQNEATRLGYDIAFLEAVAEDDNSTWLKYCKSKTISDAVRKKLEDNKTFWAIYLRPKEPMVLGGDLWVFVNRENGDLITTLRGQ